MIERLRARNFQAHEDLDIEFAPVTTVVGPTDIGKSSIVRMIQWVCLNRPSGTDFIRFGEDSCVVRLDVDDHAVVRKRSKSENLYRLDGNEYKAFGNNVPDSISELLNIAEVNFQNQLDSPFWLMQSGGEVSRELNAIINLGAIDSTLAHVATELRRARSVVEVTEDRLKQATTKRDGLDWVPVMLEKLQSLDKDSQEIAKNTSRIDDLAKMLKTYSDAEIVRSTHRQTLTKLTDVVEAGLAVKESRNRYEGLYSMYTEFKQAYKASKRRIPDLSELETLRKEIVVSKDRMSKLIGLVAKHNQLEEEIVKLKKKAKESHEQLDKELGDKCPLCGKGGDV